MNVCVIGMWHLGSVTAACLAAMGHRVVGWDADARTVQALSESKPPLFEPGLGELVAEGISSGRLSFTTDHRAALRNAEIVWVTYDTPVDDEDVADVNSVMESVRALYSSIEDGAVVIISSQLVAGCTSRLQEEFARAQPMKRVDFVYSPENLRLGKAIDVFMHPDRVVVGANGERARSAVENLLDPFADRILWMSVESAEMTKHALNAFLAMCVTFANDLAAICEQVGADAKEVERGLKSEKRIGPSAYLAPGAAFAGGTLARDVQYLRALARDHGQSTALLSAIKDSNDAHRSWPQRKLAERFESFAGRKIGILGLTYKPGTDTLRRSTSIELCVWLAERGAHVSAHDPRVRDLPPELSRRINLFSSIEDAVEGCDALVIATPWPEYAALPVELLRSAMRTAVVIDANRVAGKALSDSGIEYIAVGTPRLAREVVRNNV